MNTLKYSILLILTLFFLLGCQTQNNEIPLTNDLDDPLISEDTSTSKDTIKNKIIIASMENKPFKTIVDGKMTGPYIDIIETALNNIDYEYEFKIMPWNRVVESVQNSSIDIGFSFFDNTERRKFAYFMEEPLGLYSMKLFAMPDSKIVFDGSLKSIEEYNIGLVQNYFYTNEISEAIANNKLKVDEAIDGSSNIEKLLNGRVDLIIEDNVAVNEYLKSNNKDIQLIEYEIPIIYNYTYLVFPKDNDYDDLRRKLDIEFKKMKANGSLYNIYKNYDLDYYADSFLSIEKSNPPRKKYFQGFNDEPISIGIIADTKPYVYESVNGEFTGFIIDFLSEALDRVGVNYKFIDIPFSRMLEELENGSLDMGADIYYNDIRAQYLLYANNPFIEYPTVIFKENDMKINFSGEIDELIPYKIGIIRNYYLGPLEEYKTNNKFNFFISDTNTQNFENLINGRIDLAIDIKSTGENIINALDLSHKFVAIDPPIFYDHSYIVFSKKKNFEVLLLEYEYAIKTMRDDGTLEDLYNKYNLDYFDPNK